jgi:hypothetical protein
VIRAIPIGDDRYIYEAKGTGRKYGRIAAGIGFPGRLPGYCCVMGEGRIEDRGLGAFHVDLLAEREVTSATELIREAIDLEDAYHAEYVFGFPDEGDLIAITRWNYQHERHSSSDTFVVSKPPLIEGDRLEPLVQLLRDRMRAGSKSLHLGEAAILSQRLLELPPADGIPALRAKDHPAVAAAGFAVMALSIYRPMRKKLQTSYLSDEDFIHFNGV